MAAAKDDSITVRGFPFLDNKDTVKHVSESKVMFVMRGLSGSGKSTIVRALQSKYPGENSDACSADDHFLQEDGSYKWEKEGLQTAHETCQSKAEAACKSSVHVVIIDNTNVCRWEMKAYMELALRYSYAVVVVTPNTAWYLDAAVLADKNKHGVNRSTLQQKVEKFRKENMNPMYWGWFLNDAATDKMLGLADKYFSLCVEKCSEFKNFMQENVVGPKKALTFSSLYNRDNSGTYALHCTAFYGGRQPHPQANSYANNPDVIKSIGRYFPITVVGIVITPKTVGARVKLDEEELKLWKRDEDEDRGHGAIRSSGASGKTPKKESKKESKKERKKNQKKQAKEQSMASRFNALHIEDDDDTNSDQSDKNSDRNNSDSESGNASKTSKTSSKTWDFRPTSGIGSRAHLTLGYAPGVNAVETGPEQLRTLYLEGLRSQDTEDYIEVEGAAIRYYDEGRCVVYFEEPLVLPSLFSGRY